MDAFKFLLKLEFFGHGNGYIVASAIKWKKHASKWQPTSHRANHKAW